MTLTQELEHLLELAKKNVAVVLADVERSTALRPSVTVDAYMGVVRIAYNESSTTPSVSAPGNPKALAETADYLQQHVAEDAGAHGQGSIWPVCPTHSRMLRTVVETDRAVWKCPGGHVASEIGQLPAMYGPGSSA